MFMTNAVSDLLPRFRGLTKSGTNGSQSAYVGGRSLWLYRYSPKPGKWTEVPRPPDNPPDDVPQPRFAHQIVYHPGSQTVYLHGGNGGGIPDSKRTTEVLSSTSASTNGSISTGSSGTPTPSSTSQTMFISAAGGQSGAQTSSNNAAVPGPSTARERNLAIDLSSPRMKRLNDFWKLELRR